MNADQEDGSKAGNPTPKDPPAVPDHTDRTAGGFGGRAPASLDLYGQSRNLSTQLITFRIINLRYFMVPSCAVAFVPSHFGIIIKYLVRDYLGQTI
jgi:hypothetical protein